MSDGMTYDTALEVIGRLRDFTREEYAGRLLHIGGGRYVVGYRTWAFASSGAFFDWRMACIAQNTLRPTLEEVAQ